MSSDSDTTPVHSSGPRLLVRHSILYGAARIAISGLDLLFIPMYTRALTPSEYGLVAIGSSLQAAVAILYTLGLDGALFRLYYADRTTPRAQHSALGSVLVGITAIGVIVAGTLSVLGPHSFGHSLADMSPSFYHLLIWGALFNIYPMLLLQAYQIRQQPRHYLAVASGYAALRGTATVVLVAVLHRGAHGWAEALWVTALIGTLLAVACLKSIVAFDRVGAILRDAVGYATPQFVHSASAWLAVSASRLILGSLVPLSQIAVYQVALGIAQVLGLVTTAVNFAYAPAFMESATRSETETATKFGRFASSYVSLLIVLAGLGIVWRHVTVQVVAGSAYAAAAAILPIVVASFALQGIYFTVSAPVFLRKDVVKRLPIRTLLSATIGVAGIPFLVPRIGVAGAAWSALVANVVLAAGAFALARRSLRMEYDARQLARTCVVVAAVTLGSYTIPSPATGWHSILLPAALSAALLAYGGTVLGVFRLGVATTVVAGTPTGSR